MSEHSMQAVVLAGGLGTRMHPHTEKVPKSMLEVAGRPFIDWQLELLARSGIRDVVLCIAHLGELIRDHVGDGARYGLSVRYAVEEPGHLLGTAGALRAGTPAGPSPVQQPPDLPRDLEVLAGRDDAHAHRAVAKPQRKKVAIKKNDLVQPFLKWAGGKRQLVSKIREYLPRKFNLYFEPFLGAAAVLFDLQPSRAVVSVSQRTPAGWCCCPISFRPACT